MPSANWDHRFVELATLVSTWSKDPSTKVGCVIVDEHRRLRSVGYNGFPAGVWDDPERYADRDTKYAMTTHAEVNAVCTAARLGVSLVGCTMYLTGPPCNECMKVIIQAGLYQVAWPAENAFESDPETMKRWEAAFKAMEVMAAEAGVYLRRIPSDRTPF